MTSETKLTINMSGGISQQIRILLLMLAGANIQLDPDGPDYRKLALKIMQGLVGLFQELGDRKEQGLLKQNESIIKDTHPAVAAMVEPITKDEPMKAPPEVPMSKPKGKPKVIWDKNEKSIEYQF